VNKDGESTLLKTMIISNDELTLEDAEKLAVAEQIDLKMGK